MAGTGRFCFVTNKYVLSKFKTYDSKNTAKNTKWGVNTWNAWVAARNRVRPLGQARFPTASNLLYISPQEMDEYLSYFVLEVRNKQGHFYPKETLYNLLCGLARYVKTVLHRPDLNFMNPDNMHFYRFKQVFKSQTRLAEEKSPQHVRRHEKITPEQENLLWEKGILDINTSVGLSKVVFFYNCKFFGLYSREDHRHLMADQFTFAADNEGRYIKFVRQGLQLHCYVPETVTFRYSAEENSVYQVFQKYLDCIGREGYFYRRPASNTNPGQLKFEQKLSVHVVSTYMGTIMNEAGITGCFTGHSVKGLSQTEPTEFSVPTADTTQNQSDSDTNEGYSVQSCQENCTDMAELEPYQDNYVLENNVKPYLDNYVLENNVKPYQYNYILENNIEPYQGSYVHKKLRFWEYKPKYNKTNCETWQLLTPGGWLMQKGSNAESS